jgi:pimeloyl-ACP methyl ester carboxylesterase
MKDYEDPGSLTLDAVRRIATPTFLIYGENSHFLKSYEYLRQALPDSTGALLRGGEHFGPLERPEELTEHIRAFFAAGDVRREAAS